MIINTLPDALLHLLFPLSHVMATPGEIDALDRTGTNVTTLLWRRQHGDFGRLCVSRERVWIITERDRSVRAVALPGKY
jgi:hypothetical protein